jgi:hypothetical protein
MFVLEIEGLANLQKYLAGVEDKAADVSFVAPQVQKVFEEDIQHRFDSSPNVRETGTVLGGAVWESLTERYLASSPHREGGKQLIDTGELRDSFRLGAPHNIAEANATEITLGSSLPKASGLDRKRPIIRVHDSLVESVLAVLEDALLRQEDG